MFLIEIVEMVSFELGEGLRKIFLSCHERGISVGAQNLPSLLFFIKNSTLSTLLILTVCGKNIFLTLMHLKICEVLRFSHKLSISSFSFLSFFFQGVEWGVKPYY